MPRPKSFSVSSPSEKILFSISLIYLAFAVPAVGSEIDEKTEEPIPDYPEIVALGEHWSGIDREALFFELESNDLKGAIDRIKNASVNSGVSNAEYLIITELLSTDLFYSHRDTLLKICKKTLEGAPKSKPDKMTKENWELEVLSRSYLYEHFLHDAQSAEEGYRSVLGDKLKKDKSSSSLTEEETHDFSPNENAALRKLQRLEIRTKKSRSSN